MFNHFPPKGIVASIAECMSNDLPRPTKEAEEERIRLQQLVPLLSALLVTHAVCALVCLLECRRHSSHKMN